MRLGNHGHGTVLPGKVWIRIRIGTRIGERIVPFRQRGQSLIEHPTRFHDRLINDVQIFPHYSIVLPDHDRSILGTKGNFLSLRSPFDNINYGVREIRITVSHVGVRSTSYSESCWRGGIGWKTARKLDREIGSDCYYKNHCSHNENREKDRNSPSRFDSAKNQVL